jgi:hypothetical protein
VFESGVVGAAFEVLGWRCRKSNASRFFECRCGAQRHQVREAPQVLKQAVLGFLAPATAVRLSQRAVLEPL